MSSTPPRINRPAANLRAKSGSLKNNFPPTIDNTSDSLMIPTTSGAVR